MSEVKDKSETTSNGTVKSTVGSNYSGFALTEGKSEKKVSKPVSKQINKPAEDKPKAKVNLDLSNEVVYSNIPRIAYDKKKVIMDLKNSGRAFDSSIKTIDAFVCAGVRFKKYKFTKYNAVIEGDFSEFSIAEAVCRSLVKMYEMNTNPVE